MHVGWAAIFDPPADGPRPGFDELRDHIGSRLARAPRYRQLLAAGAAGVNAPVWVDDEEFDLARHVVPARSERLEEVVATACPSRCRATARYGRCAIADRLDDGRIGLVGKAHHCMVDGIAAVELAVAVARSRPRAAAVRKPTSGSPRPARRRLACSPTGAPTRRGRARGLRRCPRGWRGSPRRLVESRPRRRARRGPRGTRRDRRRRPARSTVRTPRCGTSACCRRPSRRPAPVKEAFGTKLNDVVLAASAGGVRSYLERRGERRLR